MTWILGIDTSHHVAVGLARDGEPVASDAVADTRAHGEALTPLIQRLCASAGIAMTGIDAYAVGMGPGPFVWNRSDNRMWGRKSCPTLFLRDCGRVLPTGCQQWFRHSRSLRSRAGSTSFKEAVRDTLSIRPF